MLEGGALVAADGGGWTIRSGPSAAFRPGTAATTSGSSALLFRQARVSERCLATSLVVTVQARRADTPPFRRETGRRHPGDKRGSYDFEHFFSCYFATGCLVFGIVRRRHLDLALDGRRFEFGPLVLRPADGTIDLEHDAALRGAGLHQFQSTVRPGLREEPCALA